MQFRPSDLAAFCCTLLALAATPARAWPDKPIRIVVTFAAGGASDIVARVISEPLAQALGQTLIRRFEELGRTPVKMSSAEFGAFVAGPVRDWTPVIKAADLKP